MARKSGRLANEQAQAILRDDERFRAQRYAADLKDVMGTPQGRRVIWSLVDIALGPSFALDPHATAFNEGRRSVALGLMTAAQKHAPDLYTLALTEQLADLKSEAATREAAEAQPEEKTDA